MINPIRTLGAPKNFIYAAMLSAAVLGGTTQAKSQQINREEIVQYVENAKKDTFEPIEYTDTITIENLTDAKKQFNERLNMYLKEDVWKGSSSGMSQDECEELGTFLAAALNHTDKSVTKWAGKKKQEFEHLKESEYNKKTIYEECQKTESEIQKLHNELESIKAHKDQPQSLIMFMLYKDDYKKIREINEEDIAYTKRDITYNNFLLEIQRQEVLSKKSVQKLKSGTGKFVK